MRWVYEVGIEQPNVLGSGSNYINVVATNDKERAVMLYFEDTRRYLKKYRIVNGCREVYIYDPISKNWELV